MTQQLFVYGTLAPGQPNELTALGGTWEPAIVKGHLQERGWGAAIGYPGLVLDEAGDEIQGFLFSSAKLADHWEELDRFEGEDYQRVLVTVHRNEASSAQAYIYVLRERSPRLSRPSAEASDGCASSQ